MDEQDKEELRDIQTILMGLSMKFDTWIVEIEKSRECVGKLRGRIHNIVNRIKEVETHG